MQLGVKLAGVHWWFKSRAHAAELTAGYYNTRDANGYRPIMEVLAAAGAAANFTCVEMRDCEHPVGRCSPQALLNQVGGGAGRGGAQRGGAGLGEAEAGGAFKVGVIARPEGLGAARASSWQ